MQKVSKKERPTDGNEGRQKDGNNEREGTHIKKDRKGGRNDDRRTDSKEERHI